MNSGEFRRRNRCQRPSIISEILRTMRISGKAYINSKANLRSRIFRLNFLQCSLSKTNTESRAFKLAKRETNFEISILSLARRTSNNFKKQFLLFSFLKSFRFKLKYLMSKRSRELRRTFLKEANAYLR